MPPCPDPQALQGCHVELDEMGQGDNAMSEIVTDPIPPVNKLLGQMLWVAQ